MATGARNRACRWVAGRLASGAQERKAGGVASAGVSSKSADADPYRG